MNQVDHFVPVSRAKNQFLRLIRDLGENDETLRAIRSSRRSLRQARAGRWVKERSVFGRGEGGR